VERARREEEQLRREEDERIRLEAEEVRRKEEEARERARRAAQSPRFKATPSLPAERAPIDPRTWHQHIREREASMHDRRGHARIQKPTVHPDLRPVQKFINSREQEMFEEEERRKRQREREERRKQAEEEAQGEREKLRKAVEEQERARKEDARIMEEEEDREAERLGRALRAGHQPATNGFRMQQHPSNKPPKARKTPVPHHLKLSQGSSSRRIPTSPGPLPASASHMHPFNLSDFPSPPSIPSSARRSLRRKWTGPSSPPPISQLPAVPSHPCGHLS